MPFSRYILDRLGERLLNDLEVSDLAEFRTFLITDYIRANGKVGKSAMNMMNGSLRALCRDAKVDKKATPYGP